MFCILSTFSGVVKGDFRQLPVNFPQNLLEPVRQGALQLHWLPGGGVDEPQPPGVEALARQAGDGLLCPVHRVPQQGVADGGQVDPDLVGAACLQAALHMGISGIPGQNGPCLLYTSPSPRD